MEGEESLKSVMVVRVRDPTLEEMRERDEKEKYISQ